VHVLCVRLSSHWPAFGWRHRDSKRQLEYSRLVATNKTSYYLYHEQLGLFRILFGG
jgi:hypothetical protein